MNQCEPVTKVVLQREGMGKNGEERERPTKKKMTDVLSYAESGWQVTERKNF
jgi:hypothetical protein